jgi:hypothetical protein
VLLKGNICPEYGVIDTSSLVSLINNIEHSDIWNQGDRSKVYKLHVHTRSLSFIWTPNLYSEDVFYIFNNTKLLNSPIGIKIQKLCDKVTELCEGTIIKAALVRMCPGGSIPLHRDGPHESWTQAHRLHLPIITEPEVLFNYTDCSYHLKTNVLTEVNNQVPHGVTHNGTKDRYHLLLDVLPLNYDGFDIISHEDEEFFEAQRKQEVKELRPYSDDNMVIQPRSIL